MAWTTPRTWTAGEVVTAALLNAHLRDNLAVWGDPDAAWTGYTPTWSATGFPTLSEASGAYRLFGKTCVARGRVVASSAVGTGNFIITAPFAPAGFYAHGNAPGIMGTFHYRNANTGPNRRLGVCTTTGSGGGMYLYLDNAGDVQLGAAIVANDSVVFNLSYEVA